MSTLRPDFVDHASPDSIRAQIKTARANRTRWDRRIAAEQLRTARFTGAMTAAPAVVALLRSRHALAELLDDAADGDDHGEINPYALAVARHILGEGTDQ
ncbi:hypothetical protein [Streptomyces sp. NPDC005953]|uniref:hypothetical protein n=1 Tax=Streptomyces sp. NPDC005953 TaxID=3156719 RepID=UPI0034092B1C